MQDIKPEDARTLLQSTQQLRTHWAGMITQHLGFAITANLVIWSYFLKSYVDSLTGQSQVQPLYILVAAALSSILLGLSRLFTHWLDDNIAGLYPDFLLYESRLDVPPDRGTSGYLIRLVPKVNLVLLNDGLTPEQKINGISVLVKSKRIGNRGHLAIDLLALLIIVGMFVVSISLGNQLKHALTILSIIGIGVGFLFVLLGIFLHQRNPRENDIKKIYLMLKGNEEKEEKPSRSVKK